MYIWRGRNRRDRRNLKLSKEHTWGPSKQAVELDEDEDLRVRMEAEHINSMVKRTYVRIFKYLDTKQGKNEIELVAHEIESMHKVAAGHDDESEEIFVPPEMKKKKNIHEIFRKYDADGSDSMDQGELKVLLDELNVPMNEEELDELWEELDEDGGGEIDFDEFYNWFVREAEGVRSKNRWEYFKTIVGSAISGGGIYAGFKKMVLEVEARNTILDQLTNRAKICARKEFRIAHPAKFVCDRCDMCFNTVKEMFEHTRDEEGHKMIDHTMKEDNERFLAVERVLEGPQGRQVSALRLLFDEELGSFESRVDASKFAPFRPFLADSNDGRSHYMLRKGDLVVGHDPTSGIRPMPRKFGMLTQFRAPGGKPTNDGGFPRAAPIDPLTDVIVKLLHSRDHAVDTYVAPRPGGHARIRFQYNGPSDREVKVCGEFNGWKGEVMGSDFSIGKCVSYLLLAPGKYLYKYIVDGKPMLEHTASKTKDRVTEEHLPLTELNALMVINPSTKETKEWEINGAPPEAVKQQVKKVESISLRNACLYDDGAWALASHMEENTSVETLDVGYNGITDDGMMALADGISRMKGLKYLKLSGNGFAYDGMRYLSETMKSLPVIVSVELSANRLGDDSASLLADVLHHHHCIQELYLDSAYIGNTGAEILGKALVHNKTLKKLSLSSNRILTYGIDQLCNSLEYNGSVQWLSVRDNPLGADGNRCIGRLLHHNDGISYLDISNTDLRRGRSGAGLQQISFSLRKNRALRTLIMRHCSLDDHNCLELAHAMVFNRGITKLDVAYNQLSDAWFKPDTYIKTKVLDEMPSFRTSTDRNIQILADPQLAEKYALKPVEIEDVEEGRWTNRRKWKTMNLHIERKKAAKAATGPELARIELEELWVLEQLEAYDSELQTFLLSIEGKDMIDSVAKVVSSYIKSLELEHSPEWLAHMSHHQHHHHHGFDDSSSMPSQTPTEMLHDESTIGSESTESDKISPDKVYLKKENVSFLHQLHKKISHGKSKLLSALKKASHSYLEGWEHGVSQAIIAAIFKHFGADPEKLMIHPSYIDRALLMLGIPATNEDAQMCLEACMVKGVWMIGFKRFVKYIRDHGLRMCINSKKERLRVLADVYLSPPIEESVDIIRNCIIDEHKKELIQKYRAMEGNEPKYLCNFCSKRFPSDKALEKHQARRSEHARFLMQDELWESRKAVLKRAKFEQTGTHFPFYFELVNLNFLPSTHSPQVFDVRGIDGRPIGVVAEDSTIRVEDLMGDWLKVRHGAGFGWCLYRVRVGVGVMVPVMQPSMQVHGDSTASDRLSTLASNVKSAFGFSMSAGNYNKFWEGLKVWDRPRFFEMGPELPDSVEIKVRAKPTYESRIIGRLVAGDIVECWAVHGHWIQLRFNETAAAWCLWRVKQNQLLVGMQVNSRREIGDGTGHMTENVYRGILVKQKEGNRWDIDYDDGVKEKDVHSRYITGLNYTILLHKFHSSLQMSLRNIIKDSPCRKSSLPPHVLQVRKEDEQVLENEAQEDGDPPVNELIDNVEGGDGSLLPIGMSKSLSLEETKEASSLSVKSKNSKASKTSKTGSRRVR